MRIAQIAPLYETVPPLAYGGTERVVAGLCNQLVYRGHHVELFAAQGSATAADLTEVVDAPLRTTMTANQLIDVAPHLHLKMLADIFRRADEFDVIHSHVDVWTMPFVATCETPVITTMHGRLDIEAISEVLPLYPDASLVSISHAQQSPTHDLGVNWAGTVYNGLDLSRYRSQATSDQGYLAFVGRITPEKRPDWAVEVATKTGLPLRVAAKVDPLHVDYWTDYIRPLFAKHDVEFLGEISEVDKPSFYANARATLFPIDWPEPFGLVMIESIASGTPVIALENGAVPEIITDGRSGFICADVDEMTAAVGRIDEILPENCRAESERFSARSMTDGYLDIYRREIARTSVARIGATEMLPQLQASASM